MIIITAQVHDYLHEAFKQAGREVLYAPDIKTGELEKVIDKATGLVVTTKILITKDLLDKAPNLKWIGRLGSGLELIDLDYADAKGIACISTPEGNCGAVGEHTLGLLLSLQKKIHTSANEVHQKIWKREENRGTELSGKTVGIIGYGNTGSHFARLLAGFDVKILAYDKYKSDFGNYRVQESSFDEICEKADVISFHVPLTKETHYMAGEAFFEKLLRKPLLLNTSRGPVVDTQALIQALKDEKIAGCGLDVLENEDLKTYTAKESEDLGFLTGHPNVIVTPHIAGYSHEAFYKMSYFLVEKLNMLGLL